jgi:hypothetical protein
VKRKNEKRRSWVNPRHPHHPGATCRAIRLASIPEDMPALPFLGGRPRPWRTWPTGQPMRGPKALHSVPITAIRTAAISSRIRKEATVPASLSSASRQVPCGLAMRWYPTRPEALLEPSRKRCACSFSARVGAQAILNWKSRYLSRINTPLICLDPTFRLTRLNLR